MAVSPNTENYTLGKGIVFFDQKNLTTGLYTGERDLGNAPAFSFNVALEKLEHFSSRGGLKAKDKSIISKITPGITFTLDEVNKENMALLTLGNLNEVTQVAGTVSKEAVVAHPGKRSDLSKRSVGLFTVAHGTVTNGPFVVGTTVAASGVSTGSGTIAAVGSGFIQIAIVSGAFSSGCTLTVATKTATSSAAPVWVPGVLLVQDAADTITFAAGEDYIVDVDLKDDKIGRIFIVDGGDIDEGDTIHVTFGHAATTYTQIQAFANNQVEGKLRFVSDNPAGGNQELEIWRVSLTPSGDTAMIGDDWATLGFTGEVLKDAVGHPDSPYMNITVE